MGQWHVADEYDGQVREVTFRSLCNSPMCPPDTAMTEWQHAVLSPNKKTLARIFSFVTLVIYYLIFEVVVSQFALVSPFDGLYYPESGV